MHIFFNRESHVIDHHRFVICSSLAKKTNCISAVLSHVPVSRFTLDAHQCWSTSLTSSSLSHIFSVIVNVTLQESSSLPCPFSSVALLLFSFCPSDHVRLASDDKQPEFYCAIYRCTYRLFSLALVVRYVNLMWCLPRIHIRNEDYLYNIVGTSRSDPYDRPTIAEATANNCDKFIKNISISNVWICRNLCLFLRVRVIICSWANLGLNCIAHR